MDPHRAEAGMALIVARDTPCRCGCKGTDPWHRRSFLRRLRDVRVQTGAWKMERFDRVATVAMPWGTATVIRVVLDMGTDANGNKRPDYVSGWRVAHGWPDHT